MSMAQICLLATSLVVTAGRKRTTVGMHQNIAQTQRMPAYHLQCNPCTLVPIHILVRFVEFALPICSVQHRDPSIADPIFVVIPPIAPLLPNMSAPILVASIPQCSFLDVYTYICIDTLTFINFKMAFLCFSSLQASTWELEKGGLRYTANVDPNEDRNQTPTTTSITSHARLRVHSMWQEITL
ncbi:hypothetical protein DE146DRAFT_128901 [Phaeosphaeria sp. MPI-PUGE-AT-0046c]|nr:hypothetical protein DE146DRAFT_128901 [Phaeosphaeria sp. MPI-PUGE-AT-0046c]